MDFFLVSKLDYLTFIHFLEAKVRLFRHHQVGYHYLLCSQIQNCIQQGQVPVPQAGHHHLSLQVSAVVVLVMGRLAAVAIPSICIPKIQELGQACAVLY